MKLKKDSKGVPSLGAIFDYLGHRVDTHTLKIMNTRLKMKRVSAAMEYDVLILHMFVLFVLFNRKFEKDGKSFVAHCLKHDGAMEATMNNTSLYLNQDYHAQFTKPILNSFVGAKLTFTINKETANDVFTDQTVVTSSSRSVTLNQNGPWLRESHRLVQSCIGTSALNDEGLFGFLFFQLFFNQNFETDGTKTKR